MPDLRASLAVLALATALPLATTPAAVASATHVIAELSGVAGLPGTLGYHPAGVNDLGQIIGSAQSDGLTRAVLWAPRDGATDLGPGLAGAISQSSKVLGLTLRRRAGHAEAVGLVRGSAGGHHPAGSRVGAGADDQRRRQRADVVRHVVPSTRTSRSSPPNTRFPRRSSRSGSKRRVWRSRSSCSVS